MPMAVGPHCAPHTGCARSRTGEWRFIRGRLEKTLRRCDTLFIRLIRVAIRIATRAASGANDSPAQSSVAAGADAVLTRHHSQVNQQVNPSTDRRGRCHSTLAGLNPGHRTGIQTQRTRRQNQVARLQAAVTESSVSLPLPGLPVNQLRASAWEQAGSCS